MRVKYCLLALALGTLVVAPVFTPNSLAVPVELAPIIQLWSARYDGPSGQEDLAGSIEVSPDESLIFVAGGSLGIEAYDIATIALDAMTGAQVWEALYDGGGYEIANDLAISPDGSRLFLTGVSYRAESGTSDDYVTVAYSATEGRLLWVSLYSVSSICCDQAREVAVSPDGSRVYVTGTSHGNDTLDDYATIAYDAATGAQLWVSRYASIGDGADEARGLVVTSDNVFVTGTSPGKDGPEDYLTVAYDALTGLQLWVTSYDSGASDAAKDISTSPDGLRVFVAGYGSNDYVTVALDATTGTELWEARYNGPGDPLSSSYFAYSDIAYSLAVSPDGSSVFVTGGSYGLGTSSDYTTVAYDAVSGDQLWVARYDGPSYDRAYSVAVSPDSSLVVVTGESWINPYSADIATAAFDAASGDLLWSARYDGPAGMYDEGRQIAFGPSGSRAYVAGQSVGNQFDYAVVAYCAFSEVVSECLSVL